MADEYRRYSGYEVIDISPADLVNFDRLKALSEAAAKSNALVDRLMEKGHLIDASEAYVDLDHVCDGCDDDEPDYIDAIHSIAESKSR
jgi:hypothetical protein